MSNTNPYADLNLKLFETAAQEFKYHLQAEHNSRIIFSGKFGHGKTTFLKWFFDQEEQKDKYNVIRLYPVNYSVASNEDIFEYIKYDIMVELLDEGYEVKSLDPSKWRLASFYVKDNPLKVVSFLAKRLPKVGKSIGDFIDELSVLKDDFEKYCEEANKAQDEKKIAEDFLKELESETGSLYEKDAITELIKLLVERGPESEKENQKETILIIDDLDRIDPEHIFRILNVFAAHFDLHSGENKFGFDKVMVVCDIENIRNIFKAKYGADTDFNGYIDKFYSHKVFAYDLRKHFYKHIVSTLTKAIWVNSRYDLMDDYEKNEIKSIYHDNKFFFNIISYLLDNNELDLRSAKKYDNMPLVFKEAVSIHGGYLEGPHYNIYLSIVFLVGIKGGVDSLKTSIRNISTIREGVNSIESACVDLAYIYLASDHKHKGMEIDSVRFNLRGHQRTLDFKRHSNGFVCKILNNNGASFSLELEDFKELFCKVVDLFNSRNFL